MSGKILFTYQFLEHKFGHDGIIIMVEMINIMPEMDIALFFYYKQSAKEIICLTLFFSVVF